MSKFFGVILLLMMIIAFTATCTKLDTMNASRPSAVNAVNRAKALAATASLGSPWVGTIPSDRFNTPGGVVVDAIGNIYIADAGNNQIKKYDVARTVTVLAGSGAASYKDGTGTTAMFNHPAGIAMDASGNMYVADRNNNLIREITPGGSVTILAGNKDLQSGYSDGTDTAARFSSPSGVAVDASGVVYVADAGNNRIRRIDPAPPGVPRTVSTWAGSGDPNTGDGFGMFAQFNHPTGIAIDASGVLYVTDSVSNIIRKITDANVETLAGASAGFKGPAGITVDGIGNVYVADPGNHLIRTITGGSVSTFAGNGVAALLDQVPLNAEFQLPVGITVDATGNVYVADAVSNRIREITLLPNVTTLAGNVVAGAGWYDATGTQAMFNMPMGVATDASGTIYVADAGNSAIRKITPAGVVTTLAGNSTNGYAEGVGFTATFYNPSALVVDNAGNVYVSDDYNNRIRMIAPNGATTLIAGDGNARLKDGPGLMAEFNSPGGIALYKGDLYVADAGNNCIRKINTITKVVSTVPGSTQLSNPFGLVMDSSGNMFVSEGYRIREITQAGAVSTLAGGTTSGSADGIGTAAQFNGVVGLTMDAQGNIYAGDFYNSSVRKITPAGKVTTILSSVLLPYGFGGPFGVAMSPSGTLYVADFYTNTIEKVQ